MQFSPENPSREWITWDMGLCGMGIKGMGKGLD